MERKLQSHEKSKVGIFVYFSHEPQTILTSYLTETYYNMYCMSQPIFGVIGQIFEMLLHVW